MHYGLMNTFIKHSDEKLPASNKQIIHPKSYPTTDISNRGSKKHKQCQLVFSIDSTA